MPNDPAATSRETPPAWASYGATDADEDFIVGSPEGLRILRDHIDRAIEHGESRIDDPRITINGFRCKPSAEEVPTEPPASALAGFGCLALVIGFIALAIYGLLALLR
jgi:hypothetical protein